MMMNASSLTVRQALTKWLLPPIIFPFLPSHNGGPKQIQKGEVCSLVFSHLQNIINSEEIIIKLTLTCQFNPVMMFMHVEPLVMEMKH